jgi:hypothetical protein
MISPSAIGGFSRTIFDKFIKKVVNLNNISEHTRNFLFRLIFYSALTYAETK